MITHNTRQNTSIQKRYKGFTTIYIALGLVVFIGTAAMVVDLGLGFQRRSHMQKATDAAALKGASILAQAAPTGSSSANQGVTQTAEDEARAYLATHYGYSDTVPNTVVTTTTDLSARKFTVGIAQKQNVLFAGIFSLNASANNPQRFRGMNISTRASATYTSEIAVVGGISGGGDGYGLNSVATANLSLMGPLATTNRGDNRSSRYTSTNGSNRGPSLKLNPDYALLETDPTKRRPQDDRLTDSATLLPNEDIPKNDGYYFDLVLPADRSKVALQLYDPGNADETFDPSTLFKKKWNETSVGPNETRAPDGSLRTIVTKTRFQVWSDNGTPNNVTDDVRISSTLYGDEPQFSFSKAGWINECIIDPALYPANSKFYMNATTVDGTGKNGFNVRLNRIGSDGKPKDKDSDYAAKDSNGKTIGNGTAINTRGFLPINFGSKGTAELALGYVPAGATSVTIKRFDVDVDTPAEGFAPIYTVTSPDNTATSYNGAFGFGNSNANDKTQTDTFTLPSGYKGGDWVIRYAAGTSDQSTWQLTYTGPSTNNSVRLTE